MIYSENPLKGEFQPFYFLSVHFSLPLFPCYSSTCAVLKVSQIPIEGKTSVKNNHISESKCTISKL